MRPTASKKPAAIAGVSAMAMAPPMTAMNRLSARISRATNGGPKPSAFSVAYSASRSRAVIAIVLAATARMITMTM